MSILIGKPELFKKLLLCFLVFLRLQDIKGGLCSVPNCVTCNSASTCAFCENGYALTHNCLCTSAPTSNCIRLDANGVCVQCDGTYIFNIDAGVCDHPTKKFQVCAMYQVEICNRYKIGYRQSESTGGCICRVKFPGIISGDTLTCGTVQNCFTYWIIEDTLLSSNACLSCSNNLFPTTDGSLCGLVYNCEKYDASGSCKCPDGTVLSEDGKTCGSVLQCKTYTSQSSDSCSVCKSGTIPSGDGKTCGSVADCQTYAPQSTISCSICKTGTPSEDGTACIESESSEVLSSGAIAGIAIGCAGEVILVSTCLAWQLK